MEHVKLTVSEYFRCIISLHIMRQMQYDISPPMTFTEVAPLSRRYFFVLVNFIGASKCSLFVQ